MPEQGYQQVRRRSSAGSVSEPKVRLDLHSIYDGPAGKRANKIMYKTHLSVTNRTVEIEREGVSLFMTIFTCGFAYLFCQKVSVEIYELQRIQTLYMKDGVIIGETLATWGRGQFVLDTPADGDKTTEDLFYELKEAWSVARHSLLV
jgi:hypothetical protein